MPYMPLSPEELDIIHNAGVDAEVMLDDNDIEWIERMESREYDDLNYDMVLYFTARAVANAKKSGERWASLPLDEHKHYINLAIRDWAREHLYIY